MNIYYPNLENVFHALSDRSRLLMVERLSFGPASVKELAKPLDMVLPSALKHLKVLEETGIVFSNKVGRVRTYELNLSQLNQIDIWIEERKKSWNHSFDRLESFLLESEDINLKGESI
ncbi:ArsR/SmtB family transcription factor [Leptospira sp. WS39.C2]